MIGLPIVGAGLLVLLIANAKKKKKPDAGVTTPPVKSAPVKSQVKTGAAAPTKSVKLPAALTPRPINGGGKTNVEGPGKYVKMESINQVFDSGYGPNPNIFQAPVTANGTTYTHIPYKK
ncbi:hypothetical protein GCM10023185_13150 [Hymenobacter saemangeumensis]|uniref:Uncharacterized protein n=1 Tax=Hymenobacter saemangeumensis TaxID=1084522 RepID=A0ABP8I7F8_9BACT